jgi:tetratricopeptide (TPR) repeat protein
MIRISEAPRAQALFTGRVDHLRRFLDDLHADPASARILFLQADAGMGKSLLLKQFGTRYCRRFPAEDWSYIRARTDAEFVAHTSQPEGSSPVHRALIDLADPSRDWFAKLLRMRDDLVAQNTRSVSIRFPRLHYALLRLLRLENRLTRETVKEVIPAGEVGLALELFQVLTEGGSIPFVGGVINQVNKRTSARVATWCAKSNLSPDDGILIDRFETPRDLRIAFPTLLARDLDDATESGETRVVLLFDGLDALREGRVDAPDQERFERDEWLRTLLNELRPDRGCIVWVAGRSVPEWSRAPRQAVAGERLEVVRLGGLTRTEARDYLSSVAATGEGVAFSADLAGSVIDYASVGENEVHPQLLGLCGDLIHQSARKHVSFSARDFASDPPGLDQRRRELLFSLTRRVDQRLKLSVYAIAAARSFDRKLYMRIGTELDLAPSRAEFELLTSLSFVRPGDDGPVFPGASPEERRFRIHDLIRRMLEEGAEPVTREAHEALERIFRAEAEADPGSAAEAVYHANRLDVQRGVELWSAQMTSAINSGELGRIQAFLEVRLAMKIPGGYERGRMLCSVADGLAVLGKYTAAREHFDAALEQLSRATGDHEAATRFQMGYALLRRGNLEKMEGELERATETLASASEMFDAVDDPLLVQDHRALALLGRAEVEVLRGRYREGSELYAESFSAFQEAIARSPGSWNVLANFGSALLIRANLAERLDDRSGAQNLYQLATQTLNLASHFAEDSAQIANNLGMSLISLGRMLAQDGDPETALHHTGRAVSILEQVLAKLGAHPILLATLGLALQAEGDLAASTGDLQGAKLSLDRACLTFDLVLELTPLDADLHNNVGSVRNSLGSVLTRLNDGDAAMTALREARDSYQRALVLAPDHPLAASNLEAVSLLLLLLEGGDRPAPDPPDSAPPPRPEP